MKFYGYDESMTDEQVALFTGAWIEISCFHAGILFFFVALFTGAWIEMVQNLD